jgi:hypothetical protein
MYEYRCQVAAVFLAVVAVSGLHAQEKNLPEIWRRIERAAEAVRQDGSHLDYGGRQIPLDRAAREIRRVSQRADIEALVSSRDEYPEPRRDKEEDSSKWEADYARWLLAGDISIRVLLDVADPKGDYAFRHDRSDSFWDPRWYGIAMAAVDTYRDSRSRDLLMELALAARYVGTPSAFEGSPVVYALGFLRSYEPEVRPKIEAAYRTEAARDRPEVPHTMADYLLLTRAKYLRSLLKSWDYGARLDPSERERYRDFEHRLWRAWALVDGWNSHISGMPYQHAASMFKKHWKQGDDAFLARIFEEPASTNEETRIAQYLVHRFSPDAKKRLEAIAAGSSSQSRTAQRALEIEARRQARNKPRKATSKEAQPAQER